MTRAKRLAADRRARVRALRIKATEICKRQPGYGSHHYRGDPYEAVALQQEADRLERGR